MKAQFIKLSDIEICNVEEIRRIYLIGAEIYIFFLGEDQAGRVIGYPGVSESTSAYLNMLDQIRKLRAMD